MNILVTGGCGFVGSALCRLLIGAGARVVNLDKLTYAATLGSVAAVAEHPRYRFVQGDVRDRDLVGDLLRREAINAVAHLAAETHVDRSIDDAQAFVRTNVEGTFELLEAVRGYWRDLPADRQGRFRFLHVSTDEVFGSLPLQGDGRFDEDSAYAPRSPYAATKAASDHLATAWFHTHGLPVVLSNCSNNFGPYQFPEKLIPLTILNALEGRALPVYGDGSNVRDWLHVDDHARALKAMLEQGEPGRGYLVGARIERSNLQVVRAVCDALDHLDPPPGGESRRSLITFVPDRPGHDSRYAIDPSRAEAELGWKPRLSFEQGLERTVRWYLANEAWWRPLRERRYKGERLGLGASRR